jgi:hypothetical protein
MNDRQRNKANMMVLIREFLAASSSITIKWSKFAAIFTSFAGYVSEIIALTGEQEADHTGGTETKRILRGNMTDKILVISEKCVGYATVEEDNDFLELVKFMIDDLNHLSDIDLVARAGKFINDVTPKALLVAEYDLEPSELEDLTTLKDAFEAIYTKPEGQIKDTAKITARIEELFHLADALLVKIDAMVKSARTTKPDFYGSYVLKREIVDLGRGKRAFQMLVMDFDTGEPVANADVMTKQKGGTEMTKSVKRTGDSGVIYENNKEAGEYTYVVKKGGCIDETGSFFINPGEMTEVVVRLKRSA